MGPNVHPLAVVDPKAEVGTGVQIGPGAVVGSQVTIGDGTEIGPGVQIQGVTTIGRNNKIFPHVCIGFDPQDLKYDGEETRVEIGDDNQIREFCTIHKGTAHGPGVTRLGSGNLLMAYSHVAHDCTVGDHTIFANAGTLAGHVTVGDCAMVGAFSAVHQFCRVGDHAYIGGYSVLTQDVLPYTRVVGAKPVFLGINRIGMKRRGFDDETIRSVSRAMRILLRSGLNTTDALEKLRAEFSEVPAIREVVEFVESSKRGIIKSLPGRQASRGGGGE